MKLFKPLIYSVPFLFLVTCKPISNNFSETENAITYQAKNLTSNSLPTDSIKVMSWNIRFGIARLNWFGDACGKNTIFGVDEVEPNLQAITNKISQENPDILFVQECDVNSKRTNYINEIEYILNNTVFNYAYYAPVWQSQFVPSHGLGKVDMGIVIFSKWPLGDTKRLALPLREDQGAAEKYFYLRYCMLQSTLNIPGYKLLHLINLHSVAFATDDTKRKQYEKITNLLDELNSKSEGFLCGGDFNTLPPGATKLDYCFNDQCEGEQFHNPDVKPEHKEGSDYTGESVWVQKIFDNYKPSLPLATYLQNENKYFTHTTQHPSGNLDRTLDYFFTNISYVPNSHITHQEAINLSDHMPISVKIKLQK